MFFESQALNISNEIACSAGYDVSMTWLAKASRQAVNTEHVAKTAIPLHTWWETGGKLVGNWWETGGKLEGIH